MKGVKRSIFLLLIVVPVFISSPLLAFEIYVSDAGNFDKPPWQILKFDENGQNPQPFITENLAWPQDIVFLEEAGTVLVSNLNSGRIDRFDAGSGAFLDVFAAGLGGPTRMKVGADGLLYVLQWSGNGRVKRFQLDGTFVDDFTASGVTQSIGLDWDADGDLYVSSFSGKSIHRFDAEGNDKGLFISSNLAGPTNIWFDASGDLLVSDYSGTAIKRFSPAGNYQSDFIQGLSQSEGVAFLPDDSILIGNGATGSIRKFGADGASLGDFATPGAGGLLRPNAVVLRKTAEDFTINSGLNDAWFNPDTSGQGMLISVYPGIEQMFLAWFTYDTELPPEDVSAILGAPEHRWLTAQGSYSGNSAELTVFRTVGGVFDASEPMPQTNAAGDGTVSIAFANCAQGQVDYVVNSAGVSGSFPIQRIVKDNEELCKALAN